MNYLAHLHLAPDDVEARIGNLLGDFLKPAHAQHLPATMQSAMQLHRWIDQFTDSHPIVAECKTWIASERQRYAGILIDIYFDHFLARHWAQFDQRALRDFSQQVYAELIEYDSILPKKLHEILPSMVKFDWLTGYQDLERIEQVLAGFARHRIRRQSHFAAGIDDLQRYYSHFEKAFLAFYPDLIAQTQLQAQYQMAINRQTIQK
ncbi:ACP phosphodiesterase [Chitinibacter sp. SCUT-21]|uniref:acyl carrier protein phosphodiesterase n=1 Tax=Chitinibacter sp. SCUT-21 TaxID=2970891 RepID=UPI0035A65D18